MTKTATMGRSFRSENRIKLFCSAHSFAGRQECWDPFYFNHVWRIPPLFLQAFTKRFKEKASYDKIDANDDVKDWLDNMTFDKKGWDAGFRTPTPLSAFHATYQYCSCAKSANHREGVYVQRLWVIWGQCCPRVAAALSLPNGRFTQLSPYFTRKPGTDRVKLECPHLIISGMLLIFPSSYLDFFCLCWTLREGSSSPCISSIIKGVLDLV